MYLGSGVADDDGVVTVEGVIPDDLDAGEHSLALIDPETGFGFRQSVSLDAADAPVTCRDVRETRSETRVQQLVESSMSGRVGPLQRYRELGLLAFCEAIGRGPVNNRSGCVMIRKFAFVIVTFVSIVVGLCVPLTPAEAVIQTATLVPSPSPGPTTNALRSVSCLNASFCIAVGTTDEGVGSSPLVLKWDGVSWAQVASPNGGAGGLTLNSVSCVSSMSCTAVGQYYSDATSVGETLVTTWDGESWTRVTSPNVGPDNNFLRSVSCRSASSCVAVGEYRDAGVFKTLVLVWNGVLWAQAASPNHGVGRNELASVSCASATFCAAVGSYSENGQKTLVLVGDGVTWTEVPSPNPSAGMNQLDGVSCVSATWCVAVGYTWTGVITENLVLVWDGSAWERMSSPDSSTTENVLNAISCVSAVSCVAVGNYYDEFGSRTSVLSWDGSVWSVVSSPSPGTMENDLVSVSCVSEFLCNAVGNSESESVNDSLVLSLTGPESGPTTSATSASSDSFTPVFTG